jgi:hypothetical protein
LQHAALGGSSGTGSGGPTFADVLSSSYGLALNDFRGADDGSSRDHSPGGMHGGMSGSGQPCDTFSHGPDSGYSQSDGGAAGGATVATSSGGPGNNAASGNSGNNSSFCDSLDTFHAEFITQPIDYPMDVSPPPPIQLQGVPPAPNCTSSGSPNCHPPMSPSLPSFLETYQHPTLEEQQASRYTFKQVFIYLAIQR